MTSLIRRGPITQSYRYYRALRDNGVTVEFIGYPLPGHSPSDPVHQKDVDRRWWRGSPRI